MEEDLIPSPSHQRKTMPDHAQELTFLMAKSTQEIRTQRLLADGWSPGEKYDKATKTSPDIKPFSRLEESRRKEYLDGAASAVMALMDEGFVVSRSETPDVALSDTVRQDITAFLVSTGRDAAAANETVDAIEAAGFTIRRGPSKALRRMEAFFEMSSQGRVADGDEAVIFLQSTVNMARKEGMDIADINAFIRQKNDEYGIHVEGLDRRSEVRRVIESLRRDYDEAFEIERRERIAGGAPVVVGGSLARASDITAVTAFAVERARRSVVPKLLAMKDGALREEALASLSEYETSLSQAFERRELGYGTEGKRALDSAARCDREIQRLQEDASERLMRWKGFRWYEKIFIPRPDGVDRARLAELQERRTKAMAEYVRLLNKEIDAERLYILPDGSVARLTVQIRDGQPAVALSFRSETSSQTSRRLFLADGSFREMTVTAEASRLDMDTSSLHPATREGLQKKMEDLSQQVSKALADVRESREQVSSSPLSVTTTSLSQAYENAVHREALEGPAAQQQLRRERQEKKDAEAARRAALDKKEEMPSLHPHLAGDITPREVEVLMAYRLYGGKGEDFKKMIEDLKEKRRVVYEGTATWRRTEAWDGPDVPTKRVFIGLRLGGDGLVYVYNPNTSQDLGRVSDVLGSGRNLNFGGTVPDQKKKQKQEKKQQDEALRRGRPLNA